MWNGRLVKTDLWVRFLADAASGGSTVINGKLFGQTVTEVNRTIYFHYSDHENARVLNNNRIVKTFADNAEEADINATLPGFYRTPGRELSLMIDEYRGLRIFAASNVPSLYCRKNAP